MAVAVDYHDRFPCSMKIWSDITSHAPNESQSCNIGVNFMYGSACCGIGMCEGSFRGLEAELFGVYPSHPYKRPEIDGQPV